MTRSKKSRRTSGDEPADSTLAEFRGVASFDTNEILVLVAAPVEEVTSALMKHMKFEKCHRDAYGTHVPDSDISYIVYRLKGHPWTIIDTFTGSRYLEPEDAQGLSKSLKTRVIFYGNSDTGGVTTYSLFDRGKRLEYFECEEEVEFESRLRKVDPPEGGEDIYPFVEAFMIEQDALAPGWSIAVTADRRKAGLITVNFFGDDFGREALERLDYVAA